MAKEGRFRLHLKDIPQGNFEESFSLEDAFFADRGQFDLFGGEVNVFVSGTRTGDVYETEFLIKGEVLTLCTRCEGKLHYPIETRFPMVIKLGNENGGDGDQEIIVARTSPTLALDDLLYSFVVLSLPLRRVHPEGQCESDIETFFVTQDKESGENPFASLLSDPRFEEFLTEDSSEK